MSEVIYRDGTLAVEIEEGTPVALMRDKGRYVSVQPRANRNVSAELEILDAIEEALLADTGMTPIHDL